MSEESENNYKQAAESLLDELLSFCESGSLSQDGLHEIIERHGLTPNDSIDHVVVDYEFFILVCRNERVTGGIIQCLLQYFPAAATATDKNGCTPLHVALLNKNITLETVEILIDAAPGSVSHADDEGWMPLHHLCKNKEVDESVAIKILKMFIERYPWALRHVNNNNGSLPVHHACVLRSHEFCRVLIEAYPGSERIADGKGMLPLHYACFANTFATVEYVSKLYPDAINHSTDGVYPIHVATQRMRFKETLAATVEIVKYLLDSDPNVKLQKFAERYSLLYLACQMDYNDSSIEAGIQVIKLIYDAHPETIENDDEIHDEMTSDILIFHQQVQSFLNSQVVYSRQAKDHGLMTTPDEKGQLPLHIALQNDVRLGSIKLLVKGNPPAVQSPDHSGALPLHVACAHHECASVVQYLIGLDTSTLLAVDYDNNTALHYACRGARHETIALLLEKYDAVSVSKRNAHKKLPIELLWESSEVLDRESIEYTESIFRLLRAYPEMIMICNAKHQAKSDGCSTQKGEKRKFGNKE